MSQLRIAPEHHGGEVPPAGPRPGSGPNGGLDLSSLDSIRNELRKLSATNQEILKAFGTGQPSQQTPAPANGTPKEFGSSGNILRPQTVDPSLAIKKENEELRKRVAELEEQLQLASPEGWAQQQAAFEQLLEEKSDVIRELNLKVQELSEALTGGPQGPGQDELRQLQQEVEERQQRLAEDEEALQQQLREMEMAMARDRADLARQKAQLERLQSDVQRELENAARDPGLRERLAKVQTLAGEARPRSMMTLPGGATPPPTRRPATMASIDLDEPAAPPTAPRAQSGFFRRMFGG